MHKIKPVNIYVFDYYDKLDERGRNLVNAIKSICPDNTFISNQVYVEDDAKHNPLIELDSPCIVFLHLGDKKNCGNDRSMDFYINKLRGKEIPVVAYSGGTLEKCPKPKKFQENIDGQKWHIFLNNFTSPDTLNLSPFLRPLIEDPKSLPRFDLLTLKPLIVLKVLLVLCNGYLAAHGCEEVKELQNIPTAIRKTAERNKTHIEDTKIWRQVINRMKIPSRLLDSVPNAEIIIDEFKKTVNNDLSIKVDDVKRVYSVLCAFEDRK